MIDNLSAGGTPPQLAGGADQLHDYLTFSSTHTSVGFKGGGGEIEQG